MTLTLWGALATGGLERLAFVLGDAVTRGVSLEVVLVNLSLVVHVLVDGHLFRGGVFFGLQQFVIIFFAQAGLLLPGTLLLHLTGLDAGLCSDLDYYV